MSSRSDPHQPRHHRRIRSLGGVDTDSSSTTKPSPVRDNHLRRPSSTDDVGDRPRAPPRSCSKSPQSTRSEVHLNDVSSSLSIPDFAKLGVDDQKPLRPAPHIDDVAGMDQQNQVPLKNVGGFRLGRADPGRNKQRRPRPRPINGIKEGGNEPPLAATDKMDWNPIVSPQPLPPQQQPPPKFEIGVTDPKPRRRSVKLVEQVRPLHTQVAQQQQAEQPNLDYSGKLGFINAKREEAKKFHLDSDYRGSILAYTEAIAAHKKSVGLSPDLLAVLFSNRAAGLLMIGAYDAAVGDCLSALENVSAPKANQAFSNDCGPMLKTKLQTRLARAYLKLGDHAASKRSFQGAIRTAEEAVNYSQRVHAPAAFVDNKTILNQMATEATLGQADAKRLKDSCDTLSSCIQYSMRNPNDRSKLTEAFGHVNMALSIAPGSFPLIESKVSIMVQMKRWRELIGYCERLGAIHVGLDNVFVGDLAPKYPFVGVSPARELRADTFGGARDEDETSREKKLPSRAAVEAVLRLPYVVIPIYIRGLRLEERYSAAESCMDALDKLVVHNASNPKFPIAKFNWTSQEKVRLQKTNHLRTEGDKLFVAQEFERAASVYLDCLKVDNDGNSEPDGSTAGGRVHAVLYCNRAACMMALRRYHAAVEDCTSALKIHNRYMKAIHRRARCYTRLKRTQEAISEYKKWLDLVEQAKKNPRQPASIHLFDGPLSVKPADVNTAKSELEELYASQRQAETQAREEADRRRNRDRRHFQENFSQSWRSESGTSAQDRRDQWYNQQNTTRRWDSFHTRGPGTTRHARTNSNGPGVRPTSRSNSNPRPNVQGSQRGPRSKSQGRTGDTLLSPRSNPTADHYAILNVSRSASADDIKKAYRKAILIYHPDKNQGSDKEAAAENFRRVKLAHETLSDPVKKRRYDGELNGARRRYY